MGAGTDQETRASASSDVVAKQQPDAAAPSGLWRVLSPSFAYAAVAASWAVQIGHGSSTMRTLGLPDKWLGLAWLVGPIAGVLVSGPVGTLSDNCTSRYGRRRPFLLAGAIGMVASLLIFSNAANIAEAFGKPVRESRLALYIAICAFWGLDATLSVMQGPARTLLGDTLEAEHQTAGNSLFGAVYCVGKCIGYAAGGSGARIEVTYAVTAGISFCLTAVTLVTSRETVLLASAETEAGSVEEGRVKGAVPPTDRKSMYHVKLPLPIARACIVQAFTYFAWMLLIVYGADWVGKDVFHGSADAAPGTPLRVAFDKGVLKANHGFLLMSALAIPLSFIIAPSVRLAGAKAVWSVSLAVFGGAMLASTAVKGRLGVYLLFSALSVPLAVTFAIPWTVAQLALDEAGMSRERGAVLSTFNLSLSLPGIAAAIVGGLVVRLSRGDLVAVMQLGGASGLAASASVWATVLPSGMS
jgi:solute carrier family 45, member 1/2/4